MSARDQASAAGSPLQLWHLSYPGGEAQRITNDLQWYRNVSLAADSQALITVQEDRLFDLLTTSPREPASARQIVSRVGAGHEAGLGWTLDGKIVYPSLASGNLDIWRCTPDGSNQQQLTGDPQTDDNLSVSPDGRYIVFRFLSFWGIQCLENGF